MNFQKHIRWFGLITVLVNASAMLSPIINSGDALKYASIAQHIALTHDWARLVLDGQDWLDKPHFPFWITAISFDLGGVSALTYILPGFIFHLIGAYYTYRLALMFYGRQTAMLAVLIYLSIFSLMDSSIEIKAEAYLGAEILAACYYWLRYDLQSRPRYLMLGALFTGMAIMTKGVFSLFTIFSGLVCSWLYQKQWSKLFSVKWLAALIMSLLAAAPELIALHLQFDRHAGGGGLQRTSAFRFFFWDSQFGRFFNTGPIQNHNGHPLFYVLAFLWEFLPWTILALAALYTYCRAFCSTDFDPSYFKQTDSSEPDAFAERVAFVFLLSMFLCTFLMFSATKFQMTYYLDIILPFMAILCANYLDKSTISKPLFVAQMSLISFLASVAIGLSIYVGNLALLAAMAAICAGLASYSHATREAPFKFRAIFYSVLVINMLYVCSILLSHLAFTRFSIPYNAVRLLGTKSEMPIYVYQMPEVSRELGLYSKAASHEIDTAEALMQVHSSYYLIVQQERARELELEPAKFRQLFTAKLVVHKTGTLDKLLKLARGTWPLESIDFFQYVAQ